VKHNPKSAQSPEFQAFSDLTKRVLSVPHAEIKRRLEVEEKAKEQRRSAKHNGASKK
jgi:hypothetical protein